MKCKKSVVIGMFLLLGALFVSCDTTTSSTSDTAAITVSEVEKYSGYFYLSCMVTDESGSILYKKRVDFEITDGDGELSQSAVLTDAYGNATTKVTKATTSSVTVRASVFGYDATTSRTVTF